MGTIDNCNHCYHVYRGPISMVVPDGHVVEKCCKCGLTTTVYAEHLTEHRRAVNKADYSSYFAPMGQYVKWGGC
jgi:hypothetical protein